MFSTLESNWDNSAYRRRATLVSFTLQALGLSLLLVIPILTIQGPPKLEWFSTVPVPAPMADPAPPATTQRQVHSSNLHEGRVQAPQSIPPTIADLHEQPIASAPEIGDFQAPGGTGTGRHGVPGGTNLQVEVAPPPAAPVPTHPLKVSHWAEGNLIYRVQPAYPPIAKQARVQGVVEMRALISKTGTIENLNVISGHPMLATAAVEAVRDWRYRPYLLNNEPIEVETEITVNFVLSESY